MFLTVEEGTLSRVRGRHEMIAAHGWFGALYTGQGADYFRTPTAGACPPAPLSPRLPSQRQLACK